MVGVASAATSIVIGYVAGGHAHDPRRRGRHHAAEPLAARDRRAVRHARIAVSRPHRSRPRSRAGHRLSARCERCGATRAAPTPFPARRARAASAVRAAQPDQAVQAVPGTGLDVPLWILGSSLYGAQLAAAFGLPYAFASHFAPDELDAALALYRARFRPSAQLAAPYAMVGANVVVAATDARSAAPVHLGAARLHEPAARRARAAATAARRHRRALDAGRGSRMRPRMLSCSFVGSPATVREQD